ncbi:MAG: hypothetical protein ACJ72D_18900 [Marmoricola sp.]
MRCSRAVPGAVLVLGLVLGLVTSGCSHGQVDAPRRVASSTPVAASSPLEVLHAWDRARAAAWGAGDLAALRRLYRPGSQAGARDVALLTAYVDRGLAVHGMRMQVLTAHVLVDRPDLLRIEVTDRLAPTTVTDGSRVRRLPVDQPSSRVVDLVRDDARWVVVAVRPVRRPRSAAPRRRRGR